MLDDLYTSPGAEEALGLEEPLDAAEAPDVSASSAASARRRDAAEPAVGARTAATPAGPSSTPPDPPRPPSVAKLVKDLSRYDRTLRWRTVTLPPGARDIMGRLLPPGTTCYKQVPTPGTELGEIAETLLAQGIANRATEALLWRKEASVLAWLAEGRRVEKLGFTTLPSLALEVLGMRTRTVRDRLRLHRLFLRHPEMEQAFLEGKMSACQALAIAPILENDGPETSIAWACRCSVRMLKKEARFYREQKAAKELSRPRTVPEEDGEGFYVSFEAPVGFRVLFDRMVELGRKHLGYDAPVYKCIEAMLLETNWLGVGPPQGPLRYPVERTIETRPQDDRTGPPEAIAHARETIWKMRLYMRDVVKLLDSGDPGTPAGCSRDAAPDPAPARPAAGPLRPADP